MITRAPIIDERLNFKLNQDSLDRVYFDYQCDTFKIDNVFKFLFCWRYSQTQTQTQTHIFAWNRERVCRMVKLCSLMSTSIFSGQAADAKRKLQNSYYDGKKKGWDWDTYVTLHQEQHAIIESLIYYGYSGMDSGTKVCHFLQGIKST